MGLFSPIWAFFAEMGLQNGPKSATGDELGATTGRQTATRAERIASSPPEGDFYASWGPTAGDALNATISTVS